MALRTYQKAAAAQKDYGFDWYDTDPDSGGPYLAADETITASTWTVPAGLTKLGDSFGDTTTSVSLSGGTAGETYTVINEIVTDREIASGVYHTEDQSLELIVT
jgi:hypothetical protein